MKSNKILAASVVFLILVNCAVLGMFWFEACHQKKEEAPQQPAGPVFEYLTKTLRLTPAQKTQYEKMRDAHRHFADSVNNETRLMRDSFFAYLKEPATKPQIINSLGKKISTDVGKMDTSTFYHFKRFRAILKPVQQTKFDEIIQDVLRGMGGPPPGGQQGPPPNGGPQRNDRPHTRSLRGGPPNGHQGERMPPPGFPPPGGPPPGSRPGGPPPNGGPPPGGGPPPDGPPPGARSGGPPPPNGGPPR